MAYASFRGSSIGNSQVLDLTDLRPESFMQELPYARAEGFYSLWKKTRIPPTPMLVKNRQLLQVQGLRGCWVESHSSGQLDSTKLTHNGQGTTGLDPMSYT